MLYLQAALMQLFTCWWMDAAKLFHWYEHVSIRALRYSCLVTNRQEAREEYRFAVLTIAISVCSDCLGIMLSYTSQAMQSMVVFRASFWNLLILMIVSCTDSILMIAPMAFVLTGVQAASGAGCPPPQEVSCVTTFYLLAFLFLQLLCIIGYLTYRYGCGLFCAESCAVSNQFKYGSQHWKLNVTIWQLCKRNQ